MMRPTRTLLPIAALASAVLLPIAARAQAIPHLGVPTGPVVTPATPRQRSAPQPPALPGSHTEGDAAAPPEANFSDMQPTDALFDAINRGDIAAVRDAIARGADIHATNILGLTPTELSVDLARNDITFLLLSMRSIDSDRDLGPPQPPPSRVAATRKGRGRQPAATAGGEDAAVADANAQPAPARAAAARTARGGKAVAAAAAPDDSGFAMTAPAPTAAPAPVSPLSRSYPVRQYASENGGTPIPQMGFLGFGGETR